MKFIAFVALAAFTIAPLGSAVAQTSTTEPSASAVQIKSKSLIGSTVRNRDGKDLGKVADLVIEPSDGRISGVVISMGGVAGVGARDITVPWNSVQVTRDQRSLVLTLQQDPLQPAPARADDKKGSEGQASPSDQKK
jgi:sporulation protein YlmC with PRC-barrel domain